VSDVILNDKKSKIWSRILALKGTENYCFRWQSDFELWLHECTKNESRSFRNGMARLLFLLKKKGVDPTVIRSASRLWDALFQKDILSIQNQELLFAIVDVLDGVSTEYIFEKEEILLETDRFSGIGWVSGVKPELVVWFPEISRELPIYLGANAQMDFTHWLHYFYEGQKVSFIDLIRQEDGWGTGPTTRIILEPDVLFQVTEISELFGQEGPKWKGFFGNKLMNETTSISILQGNLINDLFDHLLLADEINTSLIQQIVRQSFLRNKLQAAMFSDDELKKIYHKVLEKLLPNIRPYIDRVRSNKDVMRIEPTFVATHEGYTGRLDLLVESENGVLDIIELKSGKVYAPWIDYKHEIQTLLYYRLIRETYGATTAINGAILYASADHDPVRNLNIDYGYEPLVLADESRNRIWLMCLELAQFDFIQLEKAWKKLEPEIPFSDKYFSLRKLERAMFGFQSMDSWDNSGVLKSYYLGLLSLQFREWLSVKNGLGGHAQSRRNAGASSIWLSSEEEKLDRFSMLPMCAFQSYKQGILTLSHPAIPHQFRIGSSVQLTAMDHLGKSIPQTEQWYRGVVEADRNGTMQVRLSHVQISENHLKRIPFFAIHEVFMDSSIWASIKSLSNLFPILGHQDKVSLLLGFQSPRFKDGMVYHQSKAQKAVDLAIRAHNYALIQGPPGTGKTSLVLVEIARQWTLLKEKAVVLAYTNRAVDEIALKLRKANVPFFTLRTDDDHSYDSVSNYRKSLSDATIILGTVASFTSRYSDLFKVTGKIPNLLVDEASQITESQLAGLVVLFDKFILIGDQNQLPPVLSQSLDENDLLQTRKYNLHNDSFLQTLDHLEETVGMNNWCDSLFDRLWHLNLKNNWQAGITLDEHYRMHHDIAQLIDEFYRPTELKAVLKNQSESWFIQDSWAERTQNKRLVFLPSSVLGIGKVHHQEANRVAIIIGQLASRKPKEQSWADFCGVVTPWRAQIEAIKSALVQFRKQHGIEDLWEEEIVIDTVERFQGSEADYMLFSSALSNDVMLDALTSTYRNGVDRKLLVSLSRARKQWILLGVSSILEKAASYRKVIQQIENNGIVLTEFKD
jgi:DNA replication ATP-dependent helicase Dna2